MTLLEDDDSLSRRGFLSTSVGVAVAAGTSTTALAQDHGGEEAEDGGNEGDGEAEDGGNEGGGSETVTVGPGGHLSFDPDSLVIEPGTTVTFVWDSDNHNINVGSQPEESDWEGHIDLESSGFEHEHTFDVEGTYEYVCDPHVGAGMTGEIVVDPDGGGGATGPQALVPDAAFTLLIATIGGMVSVLSLAYGFMRYGGPGAEN